VGYDVSWSSGPITDELFWNSANPVDSNGPQPPGTQECLDLNLAQCSPYYWAIKSVDIHGVWSPLSNTSGATTRCINGREVACALAPEGPPGDRPALPRALAIGDITPNPARTPVVLPLAIPAGFSDSDIRLSIFDVTGRLIRTLDAGRAEPGYRDITWDLRDSGGALRPTALLRPRRPRPRCGEPPPAPGPLTWTIPLRSRGGPQGPPRGVFGGRPAAAQPRG
jgi:hypothetical protein